MSDRADRQKELEEAKNQPFARYEIDAEADKELKEKVRFGDPLKLIKSSNMKSNVNQ